TIPAAGITAANTGVTVNGTPGQNLGNLTTYLVAISSGLTLSFWSGTTHGPSSTAGNVGTEIVSGSDGITLVGLVHTGGSGFFFNLGTLSWLNRGAKTATAFISTQYTTLSTSYVELAAELRAYFATWGEEVVIASIGGNVYPSANVNSWSGNAVSFDGGTV